MTKRLTTDEFIKRAKEVHGDKYDYSLVEYKANKIKVRILCPIHGVFEISPYSHINKKRGCPCCSGYLITTKTFIEQAITTHGNKYDYSNVIYKTHKDKVQIICSEHGIFEQIPHKHLNGQGCPKCSLKNRTKLTIDKFIKRSSEKHNNKYDYSKTIFTTSKDKVKIICPIHGTFEQRPDHHLIGGGCFKCAGYTNKSLNIKNKTTSDCIFQARKIHGDKYNYSKSKYISPDNKVIIICPIHGEFKQTFNKHFESTTGCPLCSKEETNLKLKISKKEFIKKAKQIHGNLYDYKLVNYVNYHTKVKIICKKHGIFEQTPINHIGSYNKCGCPVCNESKGEKTIYNILQKYNIKYETQKTFNGCIYIAKLRFDFYLSEYNLCIEYDGEQHFKIIEAWGGKKEFDLIQKKDKIKNQFCKDNNITLYRIKYSENIKDRLIDILKKECII